MHFLVNTYAVIPCIVLISNLGSDATLIEGTGRKAPLPRMLAVSCAH